jgi:hypothetical protein
MILHLLLSGQADRHIPPSISLVHLLELLPKSGSQSFLRLRMLFLPKLYVLRDVEVLRA